MLLGLLSLKPQLGIFFPLLLIAERNWRAFIGAAVTTLTIVATTALIWGVNTWTGYLTDGIATQSRVLSDPALLAGPFMPTVFMNLRTAGVSIHAAAVIQGVATFLGAAAIMAIFINRPNTKDWLANAAFLAASALATPYLMSYDTLPLTAAVLVAAPAGASGRGLTFAVWLMTSLQLLLGPLGVPGPAIIPPCFLAFALKQRFPLRRSAPLAGT